MKYIPTLTFNINYDFSFYSKWFIFLNYVQNQLEIHYEMNQSSSRDINNIAGAVFQCSLSKFE